jgi:hypothetical protein
MTAFSYYCLDGLGMLALALFRRHWRRRCALFTYFPFGVWRDDPTKRNHLSMSKLQEEKKRCLALWR